MGALQTRLNKAFHQTASLCNSDRTLLSQSSQCIYRSYAKIRAYIIKSFKNGKFLIR